MKNRLNINHVALFYSKYQFYLKKKKFFFDFPFTQQIFNLTLVLIGEGLISSFTCLKEGGNHFKIRIFLKKTCYKRWILYSKVQRSRSIKYNELKKFISQPKYFSAIILLNTSYGLIPLKKALQLRIGGILHSIIQY